MTFYRSPSKGEAVIFTWLADKVLGGFRKAFDWGWDRAQWAAAQDRYDLRIISDYSRIRIRGQTDSKLLKDIYTDVYVLDQPTALRRFDPESLRELLWQKDRSLPLRYSERRQGETIPVRVKIDPAGSLVPAQEKEGNLLDYSET
jgi:hypothetical protein